MTVPTSDVAAGYTTLVNYDVLVLTPGVCLTWDSIYINSQLTFMNKHVHMMCDQTDGGTCTFSGAELSGKGVVYVWNNGGTTILEGFIIRDGDSDSLEGGGGGLVVRNSIVEGRDCMFIGNTASSGGAIFVYTDATVIFKGVTFTNNTATNDKLSNDLINEGEISIYSNCIEGEITNWGESLMSLGNAILGTAKNLLSTPCAPCPKGTYNPFKNAFECIKCGKGKHNANIGSMSESDCTPCPSGSYNEIEGLGGGQDDCSVCEGESRARSGSVAAERK